jgi:MFS transporter, NNP family, nitrate/nitrite transporter
MGFNPALLWTAPEVNPVNRKARSIPALNLINVYGRVFFFAWFGFMIAFWAWYAFPPLLTATIKTNLNLTPAQVANSNIVSLAATLLVRASAGPLCDMFGPRKVFGGLLLVGAIPVGLSPLIHDANGLYAVRFFTGILGGSFVPCQVWSTGFFDKNVVGTANALTGGFGNAGGGITYFIMPAVYDSFVGMGYGAGPAWRLTFLVPLIMVIAVGIALLLLCPDTPTGKWSERHLHVQENLQSHGAAGSAAEDSVMVDVPGGIADRAPSTQSHSASGEDKKDLSGSLPGEHKPAGYDHEAAMSKDEMITTARGEVVVKPSFKETAKVLASPQTLFQMFAYFCSFGTELAVNSILSAYYVKNFPTIGQTPAANWAAMFGFLNFITRPLGGFISDLLYNYGKKNLWLKKGLIVGCGVLTGLCLIIIGKTDPHNQSTMFGLIALMAIFLEAGNGANFSLVPHVHPYANGIVSGFTGACGNMGGIVFAIIFRFLGGGTAYAEVFWVIGIFHIIINLGLSWVPPIPKGQIGGR